MIVANTIGPNCRLIISLNVLRWKQVNDCH